MAGKRCEETPMISMDMKATLKGANIKGYACAKKSMVMLLMKRYVEDAAILQTLMERMEKIPGDTIYVDLDIKLTVGNE